MQNIHGIVKKGLEAFEALGLIREIRPGMVDIYADVLNDLPGEVISLVFSKLKADFQPRFAGQTISPALVRETAMDIMLGDEWSEAFHECAHAASKLDNPIMTTCPNTGALIIAESFHFSSPIVKRAFEKFGGVDAFKDVKDGDTTIRAQFRDVYKSVRKKAQGDRGAMAAIAQHKNNVARISDARSHPMQIAARVEKSRNNIRVLPDLHPDLRDGVARKAQALQDFVAKGSDEEERDALRRRAQAQWMQTGAVECWKEIEQPVQPKPSRDHLGIVQAAKAVGLSVESFKFYAMNARVSIHEFHSPSLGMQEYVLVPDISKVFAAWESMNASAQ